MPSDRKTCARSILPESRKRFPECRSSAGHQGYPFLEEVQHNLYYYKNIRGDVSGYLRSVDTLRELLDRRAHDGTEPVLQ